MRRIDLTPGFPAFLMLLWYTNRALFGPFLAAVAVHEAAHAAVLLLLGAELCGIRLGFAQLELRTGFLSWRTELWSAAAGPAVNLLCGTLFGRAAPEFAAVSLLLGTFNLLPVWPLDGGRVLRAALTAAFGLRGAHAAELAGLACGILICAAAVYAALWWQTGIWPVMAAAGLLLRLLWMRRTERAVAFPRCRR